MSDLKTLITHEISDCFAGFGHPGEPETPQQMQRELMDRINAVFNNQCEENRYIYHYVATRKSATLTGIAQLTWRIKDFNDLCKLKALLKQEFGKDFDVISSLSYLGREQDDA